MITKCIICGDYCRPNEFGFCDKHEDTTKRRIRVEQEYLKYLEYLKVIET